MRSTEAMQRYGISYRQLDLWCRHGWIHAGTPGSGNERNIPDEELPVLRLMAALVQAGFLARAAAAYARHATNTGAAIHQLAPGVTLTIQEPSP